MSDPRYSLNQPDAPYLPQSAAPRTEPMAVAALVVSLLGVLGLCAYGFGGLLGAVGAILGHVARRRIRARNGSAAGLATAAVTVGWIVFALGVLIAGFLTWAFYHKGGLLNAPIR